MENQKLPDFIAIDDDRIDNMISLKMIQQIIPGANVVTFISPESGLEHLRLEYCHNNDHKAIVFLDINMPTLSGWEVLDKLENFPDLVKAHIKVFMLSSSVNPRDKEKADANHLVSGFVQKPITKNSLDEIMAMA